MEGMYNNCYGIDNTYSDITSFLTAARNSSSIWGGDFFMTYIILHFKIRIVQAELHEPDGGQPQIWLSRSYERFLITQTQDQFPIIHQNLLQILHPDAPKVVIFLHKLNYPHIPCNGQMVRGNHYIVMQPVESLINPLFVMQSVPYEENDGYEIFKSSNFVPHNKDSAQALSTYCPTDPKIKNESDSTKTIKQEQMRSASKPSSHEKKKNKVAKSKKLASRKYTIRSHQVWFKYCKKYRSEKKQIFLNSSETLL